MLLKTLRTEEFCPYGLLEFVLYGKNVLRITTQIVKTRDGRNSHTLRLTRAK